MSRGWCQNMVSYNEGVCALQGAFTSGEAVDLKRAYFLQLSL